MKRVLSLVVLLMAMCGIVRAQDVETWTFVPTKELGITGNGQPKNVTLSDMAWTVTFDCKNTSQNDSHSGGSNANLQIGTNNAKLNSLTLSTDGFSGKLITKVVVNCTNASNNARVALTVNVGSYSEEKALTANSTDFADYTYEPNVAAENLKLLFVNSATKGGVKIHSITVFTQTESDSRADVTLQWSRLELKVSEGEQITLPDLLVSPDEARGEVKFSTSDAGVVSVAADGALTVAGIGTATITASIADSETYKDASASYKVTVIDPNEACFTLVFGSGSSSSSSVSASTKPKTIITEGAELVSGFSDIDIVYYGDAGKEGIRFGSAKGNGGKLTINLLEKYKITRIEAVVAGWSETDGCPLSVNGVASDVSAGLASYSYSEPVQRYDITIATTIAKKREILQALTVYYSTAPEKPELPATPVFYINGVENADGVAEVAYGSELKVVSANATSLVCSAADDVVEGDSWTVTLTDDETYEVYGVNEVGESEVAEFMVVIAPLEAPVVTIAGGEVCVERDEPYVIEQGTTISVACEGATSIEVMELNSEDIIELTDGAYTFTELGEYSLWFTATNPKDKVGTEITVNFTVVERNVPEVYTATFDFTSNDYGMKVYSGNAGNVYNPDPITVHNGTVSLTLSSGKSRMWKKSDSQALRFYKECVFTYSVPVGYKITDVECLNDESEQSTDVALQADKSTDNVVVYKSTLASDNASLSMVTVTYEVTDAAERGIVVDGKSSAEVDESFEFKHGVTMIVLTAPKGHTIHYGFEANPAVGRRAAAPADKDIEWNEAASNPYVLVYDEDAHRNQILHMYTTSKEGEDSELTSLTMPTGDLTGIGEVEADGGVVEFFDLRGVRVARPGQGIYLRRQGSVVSKVAVR